MDETTLNNKLMESESLYLIGIKSIEEKDFKKAKRSLNRAAKFKLEVASYKSGLDKTHLLKDVQEIYSKINLLDAKAKKNSKK